MRLMREVGEKKQSQSMHMKVIAIDIDKAKAIFCVLERDEKGDITTTKEDTKFVVLNDDKDSAGVRNFQKALYSFFDRINPDKIVILARQMKGRFKAASISFKIEALIQAYKKVNVAFMAPQTLKAYYKKHELELPLENGFQEDAIKLGNYILNQVEE